MTTHSAYIFTDNQLEFNPDKCAFLRYAVWQKEKGSHEHFQGYIELKRSQRIAALKKIYPTIHFEPRKGTQEQAIAYCRKVDTRVDGPWEFGSPAKKGARTDLSKLKEYATSGKRKADMPVELYESFAKYPKFYNTFERMAITTRRLDLKVLLVIGPTGTGKTRLAYDNSSDLYVLPILGKRDMWFDGYDGHKEVLLDDFSGQIPLTQLLRLLDVYEKTQVPIKGGFVNFTPDRIIITTNIHPSKWYKYHDREEQYPALCRRITHVIRADISLEEVILKDSDDYKDFLLNVPLT